MKSIQLANNLNKKEVSRDEVLEVIKIASLENQTTVVHKLQQAISCNCEKYIIEIEQPFKEEVYFGLNTPIKKSSVKKVVTKIKPTSKPKAKNSPAPKIKNNFVQKPVIHDVKKNSLQNLIKNQLNKKKQFYRLSNNNFADFLGNIEIKRKESVVITLSGGQGSMKTRFAFQFINAFAQNYKVGHLSIEEHPESSLYIDKAHEYIKPSLYNNIEVPIVKDLTTIHKTIANNDVIIIDSFQKLKELDKSLEIDKDFRIKYDGKLFLIIFQQTTNGSMRGGSKSQFDADVVLFTQKFDDYKQNFVYNNKNRYLNTSFDSVYYNIYSQKTIKNG